MIKRLTYILTIGLFAVMLASCSTIIDDQIVEPQDSVGINFTIAMQGADDATRSISSETIREYESAIDPDQFRVIAYTQDGSVHDVYIAMIAKHPSQPNTYNISGKLQTSFSVIKVVVLANANKNYNISSPLSSLNYDYNYTNFNPANPKSYIPMWGEKSMSVNLRPGQTTDIGTIYLLRAMSKVTVKSVGEELIDNIRMDGCNNIGRCVPDANKFDVSLNEVTTPTLPNGVSRSQNVVFFKISDKEAFIYLPEQNKSDKLQMIITLDGKDYNLDLKNYTTLDFFNVLRNVHFKYDVNVVKVEEKFMIDFKYKVVEWGVENIDIDFN